MTKLYYTCPIKALYMSKEFGVKFYTEGFLNIKSDFMEKELGFHLEIGTLHDKLCEVNSKIYVARESEHIFEPKCLDIGFTSSRNQAQFDPRNDWDKVFIFLDLKPVGWSPINEGRIIMRDNKQFFMPEVEQ